MTETPTDNDVVQPIDDDPPLPDTDPVPTEEQKE